MPIIYTFLTSVLVYFMIYKISMESFISLCLSLSVLVFHILNIKKLTKFMNEYINRLKKKQETG